MNLEMWLLDNAAEWFSISVSTFAIVVSLAVFLRQLREAQRPVLVFTRTGKAYWRIDNVGTGPAIEVRVLTGNETGWHNQVVCAPIAAGESLEAKWIHGWQLGCNYTDVFKGRYHTRCQNYRNTVGKHHLKGLPEARLQWEVDRLHIISKLGLEGKTTWELDVLRNEYFARHGYIFKRQDLQQHFASQSWYHARHSELSVVTNLMSEEELMTAGFIGDYQKNHGLITQVLEDKATQ